MGHEQVITAIHKKDPANYSRLPRLVASKGSAAEAPNAWWLREEKMLERTLAPANSATPQAEKPAACGLAARSPIEPPTALEPVSLPRGRGLCDVDEPLRRVYFVEAGVVSI